MFLRLDIVIFTGRTEYTEKHRSPQVHMCGWKQHFIKMKVVRVPMINCESNWREGKRAQFALKSPEALMRSHQSRNHEKGNGRGTTRTRRTERGGAKTNMPKFLAGITNPAGRTAFCRWTVRSVSDTLVWETRKSLDDAHRRGAMGTVLFYMVALP